MEEAGERMAAKDYWEGELGVAGEGRRLGLGVLNAQGRREGTQR
jgi:hypothetical protein